MAAIYLAPFYLLVCVYILLRSLHWFQVLHTVFRNVWVCRGIGLVYLFVVFTYTDRIYGTCIRIQEIYEASE